MTRAFRAALAGAAALALAAAVVLAQAPLKSGIDRSTFDPSVRPQDDFFRHVNGGWLARTEIPPDKSSYGAFHELADRAELDVAAIIEAAAASTDRRPGTIAQQVGDLYASFMNEARAESLGASPLKAGLDRIDTLKTAEEFAEEAGALSAINAGGPIDGFIAADAGDPTMPIIYLVQGGTALPDREFYLSADARFVEIRAKYLEFLETIFTLTGRPAAAAGAKAVLDLETELARLQWTQVESRDVKKTYNRMPFARLAAEMPGFDWAAWARPQGIDRVSHVVIAQPSFFTGFAAMVPRTPLATWKAWLSAQYIRSSAPYLSRPFVDALFEFFGRTLSGQQELRPRWKRGVSLVNGNLGEGVGRLYVERHFPPAAKARMEALVANLIEAYRQSIAELDWMTPATRKEALEKLSKFTTKIGYPDRWRDYRALAIRADDLLGNVQRAQRFEHDYQVAKLGKPVDRGEWLMTPQTVNAYYNPVQNEIVFPAAILQPPFFNLEADDAVNYGGIGAVIGHEIGHGFDDQGRRFDGTGALRDWWAPEDEAEFQRRAKILVEQFNAFSPIEGMTVNGQLTLGENIGDLGGLSIAFKAYRLSLGGRPAPAIDGFTGDQRLFIGWAQVWRSKEREQYLRQLLLANPHAPPRYRANGPLANIPAFYEAFGVKPGDPMYREPDRRVKIW